MRQRLPHLVRVVWAAAAVPMGLLVSACPTAVDCEGCRCEGDNCAQGVRIPLQFTPTDADFANPERGMMRQRSVWPDRDETLSTSHDPTTSLLWFYIRLDNYRTRPLDADGLARIGAAMDRVRDAGLKAMIRFTYNFELNGPDASLAQVLEHIEQLSPLLHRHADVIAVVQAGFVGSWGEWHGSPSGLTSLENERAIMDALMAAVPENRMLQLRYPADKEALFGGPLDDAQAFSGSPSARVGHHNDCFLSNDTDSGTYRPLPVEQWKSFVAQEGRFTPVGGETCQVNPPRSLCPTALSELEQLHWSFLNEDYHPDVLAQWHVDGCMDTIRRRLGYRLSFVGGSVVEAVRPGGLLELEVRVRNEGYAAMYNRRPVFVVFVGDAVRYGVELTDVDPRRFEPGSTDTISVRVQLPADALLGDYRVALWLPDEATALRNRSEYAVRFANEGLWEAATGYNVLTSSVRVTDDAVGPTDPSAPTLVRW